jgi:hypothetical protein
MRTTVVLASLLALSCATAPTLPAQPPTISSGRPNFEGQSSGFWVWADSSGWHLRTSSAGQMMDFSGVISPVGGTVSALQLMREGACNQVLRLTERGIEFSLPTMSGVEGFDWRVTSGCSRFELKVGGEASPGMVHLGGTAGSPATIPFEVCQ